MPARRFSQLSLVVIALVLLGSCSGDTALEGPIVVGTFSQAIDYSPYYVARELGWFSDAAAEFGDSVAFIEFQNRDDISAALDNGALHVIFAAAPPLILTRAQGNALTIFEVSCTLQQEIVVRRGINASTPADLAGLRVAVLAGTSSHYGLLNTLSQFGLDDSAVDMRFMGPVEAKAAFEGGSIDAWAVWPPFVEEQQHAENGTVLRGGDAVIQSVAAIDDGFATNRPELSDALAAVVRRAKVWILENPNEARVIVARELNLDPEVVELAWGKHDWSARMNDAFQADIATKVQFLRDQNLVRRNAPADLASAVLRLDLGGTVQLTR